MAKDWRRPAMRSNTSTTIGGASTRYAYAGGGEHSILRCKRQHARVCGLRRTIFYAMLSFCLAVIVLMVVGMVLTMRVEDDKDPGDYNRKFDEYAIPPGLVALEPLAPVDPMPDTAIAVAAFSPQAVAAGVPVQQSYRLFYQQFDGATRELSYESNESTWRNATTIFTDARNNTGLATFSYLNQTERNLVVLYVSSDNRLLARQKTPVDPVWQPLRSLGNSNLRVHEADAGAAGNGSLAVAAVYSTEFSTGPGARVFYHTQPTGAGRPSWVQELVWDERTDSWSAGARIRDVAANSRLTATVHGSALRLFYCSGNRTLQESWMNISDTSGNYTKGIMKRGILARDDSHLSAITVGSSTLVYYADARSGVRELNITGSAGAAQTITFNPSTIASVDADRPLSIGSVTGLTPPVSSSSPSSSDGDSEIQQQQQQQQQAEVRIFFTRYRGIDTNDNAVPVLDTLTRPVSTPSWPPAITYEDMTQNPLLHAFYRLPTPSSSSSSSSTPSSTSPSSSSSFTSSAPPASTSSSAPSSSTPISSAAASASASPSTTMRTVQATPSPTASPSPFLPESSPLSPAARLRRRHVAVVDSAAASPVPLQAKSHLWPRSRSRHHDEFLLRYH